MKGIFTSMDDPILIFLKRSQAIMMKIQIRTDMVSRCYGTGEINAVDELDLTVNERKTCDLSTPTSALKPFTTMAVQKKEFLVRREQNVNS